jgi:hypothetical protein
MKQLVMLGVVLFGAIGSYVPMLFTDDIDAAIIWSILGGLIGGIFGIWAAVKLYNLIG